MRQLTTYLDKSASALADKDYRAAHHYAIEAIKLDPHHSEPYYLLAILTADHNNFPKALELLDRALSNASKGAKSGETPENARYMAQRAMVLTSMNRHVEAARDADAAAQQNPQDSFTNDTIGVVYSRIGDHEKAVPYFQTACDVQPENAALHYNLGSSLRFSGDFNTARQAFKKTIELQPSHAAAYYALATLEKQTQESNNLQKMQDIFATSTDADSCLQLGHAIAKTLEDLNQFEDSYGWLEKAKARKKQQLKYSFTSDQHLFSAARNLDLSTITDTCNPDSGQIFVVGMPRTGTTLTDRIITSHSAATSMGELTYFGLHLKQATGTPSHYVLDPETLGLAGALDLEEIGQHYIASTNRLRSGAAFGVDKMPLNFFYIPLILRALPDARIVCLRRNPVDTCLSNFRQLFRTSYSYYNYAYDIENTARYYAQFQALTEYWQNTVPSSRLKVVAYEDLVLHQEETTRAILDFTGLPFEEACLHFQRNTQPTATASSVQVRQPIYTSSLNRWEKYGPCLDPLLEALKREAIAV